MNIIRRVLLAVLLSISLLVLLFIILWVLIFHKSTYEDQGFKFNVSPEGCYKEDLSSCKFATIFELSDELKDDEIIFFPESIGGIEKQINIGMHEGLIRDKSKLLNSDKAKVVYINGENTNIIYTAFRYFPNLETVVINNVENYDILNSYFYSSYLKGNYEIIVPHEMQLNDSKIAHQLLREVKKSRVSYYYNYEDSPNNGLYIIGIEKEGDMIFKPNDPAREGYIFSGWFTEKECINEFDFGNEDNKNLNNLQLFAKWNKSKDYVLIKNSDYMTASIIGYLDNNVSSITVPSIIDGYTIIEISDNAFRNLGNLNYVYIPSSIHTIGENVFGGCNSLEEIIVAKDNKNYYSNDDNEYLIERASQKLIKYTVSSHNVEVTLDESIKVIGKGAFEDAVNLKKVVANGVVFIKENAFKNSNLEEIEVNSNLQRVKKFAFENTPFYNKADVLVIENNLIKYKSSLEIYVNLDEIGEDIKYISDCAFVDSESVKELILPINLYGIGNYAFSGLPNLEVLYIPALTEYLVSNNSFSNMNRNVEIQLVGTYIDELLWWNPNLFKDYTVKIVLK